MDGSCDVERFSEGGASLEMVEFNDTGDLENTATSSISFFIGVIKGKFNAIEDATAVSIFINFDVFDAVKDFVVQDLRLCPN